MSFDDFLNLLKEILQEQFTENVSEKVLQRKAEMTFFLNAVDKHDVMFSETIMKIVLKAAVEDKMEENFRDLLLLVLGSSFASSKIDCLISAYLPFNPDVNLFQLLVCFLKLAFELFPGRAYDMYYYRVENLVLFSEVQRGKLNITEEMLQELEELRLIAAANDPFQAETEKTKALLCSEDPPNDFRKRRIIPTTTDLLDTETKDVFLRKNKKHGAYTSVDDYLDVQFRLMYEDFIQPLREGIKEYKNDKNKKSFNIKVYHNVRLLNREPNRRLGIIQYVQLDKSRLKRINWSHSKRLLFGSLLCFSCDEFETLWFATVANRDDKDIKKGILSVKFLDIMPSFNDEEFKIIETLNMFESYKHVLSKLQKLNETNLPMKKYLVFAETEIALPGYLNRDTRYWLNNFMLKPGDPNANWPQPKDLKLNDSQFAAFKSALTKELTIIQGPPGTGKTYLGLKICSSLISDAKQNCGPILVVCYTNHALDQFLEGISDFTDKIVRVGGQSKSEKIQKFSLQKWKEKKEFKVFFNEYKWNIHNKLEDLEFMLNFQKHGFKSIIPIEHLKFLLSKEHYDYLKNIGIDKWLSGKSEQDLTMGTDEIAEILVEEMLYQEIEGSLDAVARSILSDQGDESGSESDSEVTFIKNQRILDTEYDDILSLNTRFSNILSLTRKEDTDFKLVKTKVKSQLIQQSLNQRGKMSEEEVLEVDSLDALTIENRWKFYQYWRFAFVNYCKQRCETTEQKYEYWSNRLQKAQFQQDESIMKSQQIIGMTTTGAARYSDVLENIRCKIVIVEEAAEVLESHILGSLNQGCQHLILMGDHKQLRPNPAVYQLSVKYNLDLSLFERLVNNKLQYNTLSVQHRMRPEIADIIRFVYDDLTDSPSVKLYPCVPAVCTNLFFFNHSEPEELNEEITSYSNKFEAELIVKFCRHLIENGICKTKITILTLYSGQLFVINSMMDKKRYKDVRVCVVDNYQGEENDVILLSLVRSNVDGKIGFTGIDNRICVSLSRAKHGLYVFGNFDLLASKTELWNKICRHLKSKNLLGSSLNMFCQNHPSKRLVIQTSRDFEKYPDCGCEELCNTVLDCDHICTRYCHFLDRDHTEYQCQYACMRVCPVGHECLLRCFEDCSNCNAPMEKIIPGCNHRQEMSCHKKPTESDCRNPCERVLSCGHKCTKLCGEKCGECMTIVGKVSPECGHFGEYECSDSSVVCVKPCESVLACGHVCDGTCATCGTTKLHCRCREECCTLLVCGHKCSGHCSESCTPCGYQCEEGCAHRVCKNKCGDECIDECQDMCQWQCVHKRCGRPCNEFCDREVCDETCTESLTCVVCGDVFPCYSICGEKCRALCLTCDCDLTKDTTYITLWTCEHSFEVHFMDVYMHAVSGNGEIVRKKCPKCGVNITERACFRYKNVLKAISRDICNVKRIIFRDVTTFEYNYYTKLRTSAKVNVFPMFVNYREHNYFIINDKDDSLRSKYFNNQERCRNLLAYKYATSLTLLQIILDNLTVRSSFYLSNTTDEVQRLMRWLNPNVRKFDDEEIEGFVDEVHRLSLSRHGRVSFNRLLILSRIRRQKYFYLKGIRWLKCRQGHICSDRRTGPGSCSACGNA